MTPRPSTPPLVQPTPRELIEFSPSTGTFRKVSAAIASMRDLPPLPSSPTPSGASKSLATSLQPHAPSTSPSLLDLVDSQSSSENCQVIPSLPVSANSSFNVPQPRPQTAPKTPRALPDLPPISTRAPKTAPQPMSAPLSAPFRPSVSATNSAAPTPIPHISSARTITTTYTTSVPLSGSGDSPYKPLAARPKSVAEGLISGTRSGSSASVSSAPEGQGPARGRQAYPYSPGATKTKEEALQAIQRWREGRARARSVTAPNATPRRPPVVKGEPRRDISAPSRKMHK